MDSDLIQQRNRSRYLLIILGVIILGLFSRTGITPTSIDPFLGDFLYAVMMFFIIGFVFTSLNSFKVALISICICFSIELLQLSNLHTLVEIRSSKIGALIFGRGFLWRDLVSYLLGGVSAMFIEVSFLRH